MTIILSNACNRARGAHAQSIWNCAMAICIAYACYSLLPLSTWNVCMVSASMVDVVDIATAFNHRTNIIYSMQNCIYCGQCPQTYKHIVFTIKYQWHNIAYNCCNRFSYARIWLRIENANCWCGISQRYYAYMRQSSHFMPRHADMMRSNVINERDREKKKNRFDGVIS